MYVKEILLLPRMDVWTKFEEDRARLSLVVDQKRKGYRRTDRQESIKGTTIATRAASKWGRDMIKWASGLYKPVGGAGASF